MASTHASAASAPRQPRVGDAYTRLKAEILANKLPPGFQAPEPEIAERLGMSRTPVREALIRLQADGLVELVPRRGARVLPVQASDMEEIYDILTVLEPHAASELARRGPSAADLAPLEQATSDMEAALVRDDLDSWAESDDRFHRTLLELHGNQRLSAIAASLSDQAHRARMITLRMREKPVKSTADHRDILDCLRQGDSERVHRVFSQHRRRAADELLGILRSFGLPPL